MAKMLLDFKPCSIDHAVDIGIRLHLRAVKVQLLSPNQSSFDAQFHNAFEKQLKDLQSKTFTNFAQTAVIGDRLIQVIANEPAMSQIEIDGLHQLSFRAD